MLPHLLATMVLMSPPASAEVPEVVDVGSGYTSVYAVVGSEGVVLVDSHNPGHADDIVARLEDAGIDPDRVTLVLLTHAHRDHAGSAADLAARLDVPVALGSGDVDAAAVGDNTMPVTGSRARLMAPFLSSPFPPVHADVVIAEPLDLRPYGVDAVAEQVGGHTDGSVIVTLEGGTVLTGDLIRGRIFRRHTPTLHLFHEDGVHAHEVLSDLLADGSVHTILPAHGEALTAEVVQRWIDVRAPRHHDRLEAWAAQRRTTASVAAAQSQDQQADR